MLRSLIVGALSLACATAASAQQGMQGPRCIDASVPKKAFAEHGGKWVVLSAEQRAFLVGVYALNPVTPPGLPHGDRAALATAKGSTGGVVFFLDGKMACDGMPIPTTLLEMLSDISAHVVSHEKSNL